MVKTERILNFKFILMRLNETSFLGLHIRMLKKVLTTSNPTLRLYSLGKYRSSEQKAEPKIILC